MKRHPLLLLLGILAVFGLVAAACGDDDTAAPAPAEPAPAESPAPEPAGDPLDANGDGQIVIGVAAAGPRDDGAYYEALVTAAIEISTENGWAEPIIIDNIEPAVAETELGNLASQGVDIIAVGAGEIADPLADLAQEYSDIFWYCNCGTGFPQTDGVAISLDNGSDIQYVAGVATGLLLQERGGETVSMIGCCDLGFEVETELAFRLGLKSIDPSFDIIYTPTGNFPFDFDNVAGATEAFNVALDAGADAVYPYLGGAHEPVVQLANEAGIITMSAGPSGVCSRTDLDYDLAVKFDGGDQARALFPLIIAGEFVEGQTREFAVGQDDIVGATLCNATPEQQAILDQAHADVLAGVFDAEFGEIKGQAYGGG